MSREERLYAVGDGGYPGAGVGDFLYGHELDAYLAACCYYQFADVGKMDTGLGDGDLLAVLVLNINTGYCGMGVGIEQCINTIGLAYKIMGVNMAGGSFTKV